MARFSAATSGSNQVVNYEGAAAYGLPRDLELYAKVCTASLQPKFYEDSPEDEIRRIRGLVEKCDPEFVAKLAIYAREEMYLRSVPLVLAVELIRTRKKLPEGFITRIIQRPDEIYEILAYYAQANGRTGDKRLGKLSNRLKREVAAAFHKFDEYQFAKYNRKTNPSLRDVLFLTHPKPSGKEEERLFKKIADQELEIPYTWETQLSDRGNKAEVWEELIDSRKVGYMATLRNLRNILDADVGESHIQKVADYISSEGAVRKSKQLPFRFLSAYREIKNTHSFSANIILNALEGAVKVSADNLPFNDKDDIVIACDVSGSMQRQISPRSKVQNYDVGLVLGMMANLKSQRAVVGMFGDTWKPIAVPKESILRNADEFHQREGEVGYSTNGWRVIEWLFTNRIKADKVMIFTDCQLWDSTYSGNHTQKLWFRYKQDAPGAKLYLFDLAGYGSVPIDMSTKDVFLISGWSDKVFKILDALDRGETAVSEINKIKI